MEDIKMSDVYGVHIYQGDILVYFSDDLFMTYEEAQKVGLEVLEEIQEEIQSKKQRGLSLILVLIITKWLSYKYPKNIRNC